MDQLLATTGYLFFLYGVYLIASNYPADPVTKGAVLMGTGIVLLGIGYAIAKRRYRKGDKKVGWEFQ